MTVGPEGGDDEKYGHSGEKKHTDPIIVLFILKKEVCHDQGHICEPQQVWDDKYLAEGNVVIRRHMYHAVIFGDVDFQIVKPCQINDSVYHQRNGVPVSGQLFPDNR